jgi:hypothetical protein
MWGDGSSCTCRGAPVDPSSCRWAHRHHEGFSLAENWPHHIFPVSELGRYVEEVDGRLWSPPSELVDKGLIRGSWVKALTKSVSVSSRSSFLFYENLTT